MSDKIKSSHNYQEWQFVVNALRSSILTLLLILLGCKSTRTLFAGKVDKGILNLRGCYVSDMGSVRCENGIQHSIFFLYENGVILYIGTVCGSEMESYLEKSLTTDFHDSLVDQRGDVTNWGSFGISGDSIYFEIYTPRAAPKTVVRYGQVLNDTTFVMTEFARVVRN